jgi:hypothetical protein
MKKALLVLAASLLANTVLLVVYLTRPPSAAPRVAEPAPAAARPAGPAATPAASASNAAALPAGKSIDVGGAKDLIARMREAGFPPQAIAAAAQSRLMGQYYARYVEIMGLNEPTPPFWSSQATFTGLMMDPARQAAQRALSREMTDAMKDILGPDYQTAAMSEEARVAYQRQYGDLPAEKISQLQQILQDASMKQSEIYGQSVGGYSVRLPEDNAKLAQIEQERRAALAALLTPEELENYDLHSSSSASQLKSQLIAFEPTEQEYRTLFKLQQAFDEKYPSNLLGGASQDLLRERSQAQLKLKEDMAAALPADRAEAYRLSTENGATTVARIVNRLELPMATVGQVMGVQKEIQAQANALRTDRTISAEVRNQALAALQQQANDRIAGQIGINGLAAYKGSAGSWIQNLVPPAPVPRGGTPVPAGR